MNAERYSFILTLLKPYESVLEKWKISGTNPKEPELKELIRVYEKLWAVKKDIGPAIIKEGCPSCISDMMKSLYNNRNDLLKKSGLTDFKGVPNKKANVTVIEVSKDTKVIEVADKIKEVENPNNFLDETGTIARIAALKAECIAKGIKFHHKAGEKKLKELLNK